MFDFVKKLFGLPTAAEKAAAKTKSSALDLNRDGKVNSDDAKVAVKAVKSAAVRAKNTAKRTVSNAKKPAAKKSTSK